MENLFAISTNRDMDWEMTHFHFHDAYEILLVTGGACSFLLESEMIRVFRGTVLLINSGQLHMSAALPEEAYERRVLRFKPADLAPFSGKQSDLLEAFHKKQPVLYLKEEELEEMEALIQKCGDGAEGYGADLRRNMAFLELMIRLGEYARDGKHRNAPRRQENRNYERIRDMLAYIAENPGENLSLEAVSEKFHYNKHYLCRIFKAATGITVNKYIASVRIRQAAAYLRQGYSVQESGLRAGFRNNSNFISTFHKLMDISPGQYRQQHRHLFAPGA